MNFAQAEFAVFLVFVLVVTWSLRWAMKKLPWAIEKSRTADNLFLLAASYYFYAYWDYRFCGLLLISTLVDYVAARSIANGQSTITRRAWLSVSLLVNLGMLGFFKYFNFFIESATPLAESIGFNPSTLSIVLPVGISFFTFQTLSYTIDVYRRQLEPTKNLLEFALYVAFFPQLVAGPIVRAVNFLPQLSGRSVFSRRRFYGGCQQLLRGAVKKVLIADRLAETIDVVFADVGSYSSVTVWIAVIGYAGQIYYDFSGYSDMAIGIAKMLGFRFPINFRHPYLATSMGDFWRRWHMTLSTWLRDYLYIPLGGSRGARWRTNRNLMITMTLGGLWHGAAMTFVLWGAWHGTALVVARRHWLKRFGRRISRPIGWILVMGTVSMGWVLFRSPDLPTAMTVYDRLWFGLSWTSQSDRIQWFPPLTLLAITLMIVEHAAWTTRLRHCMRLPWDAWYSPVATAILVWSLLLYSPHGFQPFVYFQF